MDGSMEDIRREIGIMSSCRHENVVSYFVSFIDQSDLWLVMPLYGSGSVDGLLKEKFKKGIKDECIMATLIKQTLEGLAYFHS
jgi:serine/threonine-protein kinase OSR1/STK39